MTSRSYHKPISQISNGPVFLAAATGAWLLLYAVGYGFRALILAVGGGA